MKDGPPCHTAKHVTGWLQDCEIDYFSDWSQYSPDLNQIENLFELLNRKLHHRDTSTIPRLEEAVRSATSGWKRSQTAFKH